MDTSKKLVYAPCDQIMVTDEVRRDLMPRFSSEKTGCTPKLSLSISISSFKISFERRYLKILFFGWLA